MSLIVDRDVSALAKAPEKRKIAFKAVLIVLAILIVLLGFLWLILWERQQNRDAVRVANIAVVQSAMQQIYYEQGHYDISDRCPLGEALLGENCWQVFNKYIQDQSLLLDPKKGVACTVNNCDEPCLYSLNQNGPENYEILFHLERGVGNYEAGCHYLDKAGMH